VRYGGIRPGSDILQMDPALSYGLVEYLRMLEVLEGHGLARSECIPHGGHQFALAIASGLGLGGNESYPTEFRPFGGFGDGDRVVDGLVACADVPGVGFEAKRDLYGLLLELV